MFLFFLNLFFALTKKKYPILRVESQKKLFKKLQTNRERGFPFIIFIIVKPMT